MTTPARAEHSAAAQGADRHSPARPPGRLRPAASPRACATPPSTLRQLRGHATAPGGLRRGTRADRVLAGGAQVQGHLPARLVRVGQEPLHGRAARPAAGDVDARSARSSPTRSLGISGSASRRLLLVPYHLLGSESLEATILGGYVAQVRREHPDAPLPAVYRAQGLIDDARRSRRIGDEAFLASSTAADGRWGDVGSCGAIGGSTRRSAPPRTRRGAAPDQRRRAGVLPSYVDSVTGAANAFVPLDEGLAVISRHAKALGYDGVVLFLDELVLWLAGKLGDLAFVGRETEKVVKLVEAPDATRHPDRQLHRPPARPARAHRPDRTGAESASFQDELLLGRPVLHRHARGPQPRLIARGPRPQYRWRGRGGGDQGRVPPHRRSRRHRDVLLSDGDGDGSAGPIRSGRRSWRPWCTCLRRCSVSARR